MSSPSVIATGVYWIRPDFGAMRDALLSQGDADLVRRQLGRIVMIELELRGAALPVDVGQIHQPGNENVPYDEVFFSLDRGTRLASAFEQPPLPDFALAFYLHDFDEASSLETPWGAVALPEPERVRPPHLAALRYRYYD